MMSKDVGPRIVAVEVRGHPADAGVMVRLGDEAGAWSMGEAVARAGFSEPAEELLGGARALGAALVGQGCDEVLGAAAAVGGSMAGPAGALGEALGAAPAAIRFAFETALADLDARRRGISLGAAWGGRAGATVSRSALVRTPVEVEVAIETGHDVLKVKAHGPWPEDLARLQAIRAAAPGRGLRIDCNGSLGVAGARLLLPRLAALAPEYVEEPAHGIGVEVWAELAGLGAPLAVDESAVEASAFEAHAAAGAASFVIVKPAFVGVFAALARGRRALAAGRRVVVTSALEGAIGAAAAAHVAFALGIDEACGITLRRGAAAPAWLAAERARIAMPTTAGLGVDLDAVAQG